MYGSCTLTQQTDNDNIPLDFPVISYTTTNEATPEGMRRSPEVHDHIQAEKARERHQKIGKQADHSSPHKLSQSNYPYGLTKV